MQDSVRSLELKSSWARALNPENTQALICSLIASVHPSQHPAMTVIGYKYTLQGTTSFPGHYLEQLLVPTVPDSHLWALTVSCCLVGARQLPNRCSVVRLLPSSLPPLSPRFLKREMEKFFLFSEVCLSPPVSVIWGVEICRVGTGHLPTSMAPGLQNQAALARQQQSQEQPLRAQVSSTARS